MTSRVVLPAKAVGETCNYQIDFLSELQSDETVLQVTASMAVYCGSDATPSAMLVRDPWVRGSIATVPVTAGLRGVIYVLSCVAETDLLQIITIRAYLAVLDPDADMPSSECCPRIGIASSANGQDFTMSFPDNPIPAYRDGLQLFAIFADDATVQSAPLTLNPDSLGAKDIYWNLALTATGYEILTDDVLQFVYSEDNDVWIVVARPRMQDYAFIDANQSLVFTAGTNKAVVPALFSAVIVGIRAFVTTASSSGAVTIDVNLNGTSIMTSNKLVIDQGETTTLTAATPPVLTTRVIANGDVLSIDIDGAGTGAKGWGVEFNLRMTH